MLAHHSNIVREASSGLARVLDRLDPAGIESDRSCESGWGPWRYNAYWTELKKRGAYVARLRESAMGPSFGQAARALGGQACLLARSLHTRTRVGLERGHGVGDDVGLELHIVGHDRPGEHRDDAKCVRQL